MVKLNDLERHNAALAPALEDAMARVVKSGWFVLGPEVRGFEQEFAAYIGTAHCVGVANGTDALEIALRALDIGPGKQVLTVANAGMYSTAAILATGARPIYADVRPDTYLIDFEDVKEIGDATRIDAIVVTHLYGLMVDVETLVDYAKARNIWIIEDCAQAHGAALGGRRAGAFGDVACFSFYPTKNLGALGDGGAVLTGDGALAERIRSLRQYGWETKYTAVRPGGRNSRLDEIQAAVLRVKLLHLDTWNERRRDIACRYAGAIAHSEVALPMWRNEEYVAHLFVVRVMRRAELQRHLAARGIATDVHYPVPDYRQPCWADLFPGVARPTTERVSAEILTLPCFPEMADQEIEAVIHAVNDW